MIIYETAGQIYIFLCCVFLGGILGLLWQLTHFVTFKKLFVALGDLIFCACAGALVFFGLLLICYGKMRFYCFLGLLLGFVLWLKTIGSVVDIFVLRIYNKIKEIIKTKKKQDGRENTEKN